MKDEDGVVDIFDFVIAASEAVRTCYKAEFICPVCNGRAIATKSTYNRHIHAYCEKCGSKR